jgi:membrane protein implicated in regulation of membrane protease activity
MFNPFDGANFIGGTLFTVGFGIVAGSGNPTLITTIVGGCIAGLFMLLAKGIELFVRSRMDKRTARLKDRAERAEETVVKLLEQNQNIIAGRQ